MTYTIRAGLTTCDTCRQPVDSGWRAKTGHVCARTSPADREQAARQARIDAMGNDETRCNERGFEAGSGSADGKMDSAKTNRPTRERRTVLSTPSDQHGKEAVDS